MKIRPMGAELFHADGMTEMTKQTVAFRNFAKAPRNTSSRLAYTKQFNVFVVPKVHHHVHAVQMNPVKIFTNYLLQVHLAEHSDLCLVALTLSVQNFVRISDLPSKQAKCYLPLPGEPNNVKVEAPTTVTM